MTTTTAKRILTMAIKTSPAETTDLKTIDRTNWNSKFAGDVAKPNLCGKIVSVFGREREREEKVTCHGLWLHVGFVRSCGAIAEQMIQLMQPHREVFFVDSFLRCPEKSLQSDRFLFLSRRLLELNTIYGYDVLILIDLLCDL